MTLKWPLLWGAKRVLGRPGNLSCGLSEWVFQLERIVLRWVFVSAVGLVLAAGFVGCSSMQPRSPEEIIAERALAQARHLINTDYESALAFVVPSYQGSARARFYPAEYAGASSWTDASVRWVRCGEPDEADEADRCDVRLWVYGQLYYGPSSTSGRGADQPWAWNTVWIKIDGEWYQYLD